MSSHPHQEVKEQEATLSIMQSRLAVQQVPTIPSLNSSDSQLSTMKTLILESSKTPLIARQILLLSSVVYNYLSPQTLLNLLFFQNRWTHFP